MALRMRSGVLVRPSRSGSSPRRTSISRTRSSKLALVSVDDSVAGFIVSGSCPGDVLLLSGLCASGVLERIHHRLFQSYFLQMRMREAALQYFEDLNAQVFRGRHILGEFFQRIQVRQVVAGEHFPLDKAVEVHQIVRPAGTGIRSEERRVGK